MTHPTIVTRYRVPSASSLLGALGESLELIKEQDSLTDGEIGAVMHKGADQGGKYRTGLAEMGVIAFLRACATWNGRFANEALSLIGMKLSPIEAQPQSDRSFGVILARLKLAVDEALENDDVIDEAELDAMRGVLDDAGRAIDARRGRVVRVVK